MITAPRPPAMPRPRRYRTPRRPDDRRSFVARARIFGVVILLLFAGLVARLWFLQIVHGADYREAADANQARLIRVRAPRGTIVDSHGVILAANRSRFAVYATPEVLKDKVVLGRLATLLRDTPENVYRTIKASQENPYDPLRVAGDVPMTTVTEIEENKPFLPGVSTQPEPVRWYPHGRLAAHLLGTMGRINPEEFKKRKSQGYFSDDFIGKSGVEREYEQYLHGTPGGTNVQIDARGRKVRTLGTTDSIPGGAVTLALDAKVQAAGEQVFKDDKFTGAAVAINPQTGAVIALISAPDFDPNVFATGIKTADWKPLNTSPGKPMIDRAIDAMYPPGSTFKPYVAAAGLQTKAINTHTTAYCSGSYSLGSARFGCWQRHGEVDFYRAIAVSCDVFFYIAGQKIGPENIARYAKAFGFAEKTGIDLPSEDIGSIPSPSWKQKHYGKLGGDHATWYGGDTLHMSIGQGDVLTTPLQMARACAAIANGGDVLKPYVVDKVTDDSGKVVFRNKRTVVRHVPVSPQNLEDVRKGMRVCVTSGTGRIVDFPGIPAGAKTGSAQVHGHSATHGLFICFAPYDHPTIAIAAIVEYGGHGASSAGRVARAMMESYFHLHASGGLSVKSD